MSGIKSESFVEFIFEWKTFIYVQFYPVCNYVL